MSSQTLEGFRLSPQQKQLWLLQESGNIYYAQCVLKIEGNLQIGTLEWALRKIVARHEALRTSFYRKPGIKVPIQVIDDSRDFLWQELKKDHWENNQVEQLCQQERQFIFNFDQDSLLRISLLSESSNRYLLLITLPSLCADSWSLRNLAQEVGDVYDACLRGEASEIEPVQYIQFSEWHNELLEDENVELGKAYWHQQDINSLPSPTIPFEAHTDELTRFEPKVYALKLESDVLEKLKAIATRYDTPIAEFLLTCWEMFLWRITGQQDIAVNTLFPNRKYEELHQTLGLLAKWLPIRCSFQESSKFIDIASSVSNTLSNHEKWQEYFLWEDYKRSNNSLSSLPISFEFEKWPDGYESDEVSFYLDKQYVCFEPFKLKLRCVLQQDALTAELHYIPELIAPEGVQYLAEQFQALVGSALDNPEATVGELKLMSDRQQQQLLIEFNQTQANYPQDQCIHQRFEEQVRQTPDNPAVAFEAGQLTYAELNSRANQLAHYLQKVGVGPETLVGVFIEPSTSDEASLTLDIVTTILGVLKAGGAYLPFDTTLPKESLAFRLEDAQTPIVLTQQSLVAKLPAYSGQVICLDSDSELIARERSDNPTNEVSGKNLAYVLFTSGSTGRPKGVAIEHRSLHNYLDGILARLDLPPGSSFATFSTFAADLGNTAIFPALCTGGCLHVVSQDKASDAEALAKYFQRYPVDCLKIVPSHLTALLAASGTQSILPRRQLILGGEAASWQLIEQIRQQAPNCQIMNHYGPTETTVGVLTYPVNPQSSSHVSKTVPLGRPLANTQVYVLDGQLHPVPIGVPGELYIGGAGLAREYLKRSQLTAERFMTNPFTDDVRARLYKTGDLVRYLLDGTIEFLGRTDNQVKIRGFRIELGEIEAVLAQHSGVQQVVVLASENESGHRRLIGYVVPRRHHDLNVSELRSFSLNKLPEYMTPSTFILLKALPLTSNGKVDRSALPAPDQARPDLKAQYVAPSTQLEKNLAEIWRELLGLKQVGIHDNFFELGGHSLLITQLLARVRDTFHVDISLRSLFDFPTVGNIAEKIQKLQITTSSAEVSKEEALNLRAEAVLDPNIQPDGSPYRPDIAPSAIFLTGATGFFGAFLLNELLEQTQADIYCLVRSSDIESGRQKLQNTLKSYLLWNESFSTRIIPIIGDLSQPLLGLSEQEFQQIAGQLDVIYHNGALVNFTYPYQALKAANVLGTQEVLRLACQTRVKPVHFISTIGVVTPSDANNYSVKEDANLDDSKISSSGYTQSKWVAEKLVTIARERGLPVCIYRPGRISGHSQTGVCNPGDHTYRMIKGCIQLGSVPNQNVQLNLSPCDYVSKAIVYLSRQTESLGKAFHLRNQKPLHLNEMVKYIRSLGYPIELVPYDEWRSRLSNHEAFAENALYPLMSIFSETSKADVNDNDVNEQPARVVAQQYDCKNTLTGLAESSIICPPVNAKLFNVYFTYLIKIGFLQAPNFENSTTSN